MTSRPSILLLLTFSWSLHCLLSLEHEITQGSFSFDIHHRYSDEVRKWSESLSTWNTTEEYWPEEESLHYYRSLFEHDRRLLDRRRGLIGGEKPTLTFRDGNKTVRMTKLGFLHYANISLGTPRVNFFVALDTGSHLLWIPCNCNDCAPSSNPYYDLKFNIYNSSSSSTSRAVTCNSSLCERQILCSSPSDPCPYKVQYLSANLSTSGVLMEDVLHLRSEDSTHQPLNANITFGCSTIQTGFFMSSAAPNGILGLGIEKVSIPSILATAGLTADSFSMCFGSKGIGRINFGDKGSIDQKKTPFASNAVRPEYLVTATGIKVGKILEKLEFFALIDSGTSFTYLRDPAYTKIAETFNSQIRDERFQKVKENPFDYCYSLGTDDQPSISAPNISLIMKGGSEFQVISPLVILQTNMGESVYCLAVIKSADVNIIGQNFMTGHRLVFDRENLILGWKEFDCYKVENSTRTGRKGSNFSGNRKGSSSSSSSSSLYQTVFFWYSVMGGILLATLSFIT